MSTINTVNTITMDSQGITIAAKQGAASASAATALSTTVTGTVHKLIGTVGNAAAVTMYDAVTDVPATWDKLFFWCDQNVHLQLVDNASTGTHVTIAVNALDPFTMSDGDLLAAASETLITNATTTLLSITQIVIGNSSGNTANFVLILVD